MKKKFLLKIISGQLKGKGLYSPDDFSVRPTSARVKDSLFNIIRNDLFSARFLDLFAGSGQIGFEALSLGADVVFCDKDASLVKKNAQHLGVCANVIQGDFLNALSNLKSAQPFDFIFADPPYNDKLYEEIINNSMPLLSQNGVLILEHSSDYSLPLPNACNVISVRKYGSRSLTFLGGEK